MAKDAPVTIDNSFSNFMFGLTLGVAGALLLGTREGRQVARTVLKSISEGLEKNENLFQEAQEVVGKAVHQFEDKFASPPPEPPPYFSNPK